MSVQVGTADPTVFLDTGKPKGLADYTILEDLSETVLFEETYLRPGSARNLERVLQLYRGAAFTVCIPPSLTSGSIRFYPRSKPVQKWKHALLFTDPQHLMGAKVGGLVPGRWIVKYFDDKNVVVLSQELELHRGELLKTECQSGLIGKGPPE